MSREIYRTQLAVLGLLITLLFVIISTYGIIELFEDDNYNIPIGLAIYLSLIFLVYYLSLSASRIFIFYDEFFITKSPFIRFYFSDKKFFYSDIKFAIFTIQYKGPDTFILVFKNRDRFKCGYYSNIFSGDKKKIADILTRKGVQFHFRNYNKIKLHGTTKWIEITDELK